MMVLVVHKCFYVSENENILWVSVGDSVCVQHPTSVCQSGSSHISWCVWQICKRILQVCVLD